jgi:hypothetical protein
VQIGLLATLPLGLRLSQLFTSTRFERLGRWRTVALAGGLAGRVALLAGLLTLLMPHGEPRVWLLVAVVATAAAGGAAYDLAIVAWMAEIVPLRLRGEFFGRRNRAVAGVGLAATLGAASVIDSLQRGGDTSVAAFALVFGTGGLIGLAGLLVLARAPAGPAHPLVAPAAPLRIWIRQALADRSFYRLARFGLIWGFAVNFASPFFAVYQISVLALPHGCDALQGAHDVRHDGVVALLGTPRRSLRREAGRAHGRVHDRGHAPALVVRRARTDLAARADPDPLGRRLRRL